MTVLELIEKLQYCNVNAEVYTKYNSDPIDFSSSTSMLCDTVLELRTDNDYKVILNIN